MANKPIDPAEELPLKQESSPAERAPEIPPVEKMPFPEKEKWIDYAAFDGDVPTIISGDD
jgi:hypothetical protein